MSMESWADHRHMEQQARSAFEDKIQSTFG